MFFLIYIRSNEGRRFRKRSSRSQSGSPKRSRRSSPGRRDFRSRGSPSGGRRDKKQVDRENPAPGRCLGVFGLSIHTREHHLKEVFTKYGNLDKVQIVYDAQTGRSRGFAFVYFENKNDAGEVSICGLWLLSLGTNLFPVSGQGSLQRHRHRWPQDSCRLLRHPACAHPDARHLHGPTYAVS